MKKRIVALLLAIAMVVAFSACASNKSGKLIQPGTLSIGVEIGYPPFEDFAENGTTPVGYDIDFAKALGEKMGLKVNFINTAWDGIFQGIGVNYDCVISAVTITDERKQTMLFSDPYINNFQAIVVKADYPGKINGFLDLNNLAVAVQKETTSDILITNYVKTGSMKCTISANEKITTCFTQLTNGEVDAVVVDSTVADGYLASSPNVYKKIFQDESEPEQFGVAIGLKNAALQSAINQAIAQLTKENFFKQNVEHWFGA
jgi:ABC-type amino acid transport substrate-binding protein